MQSTAHDFTVTLRDHLNEWVVEGAASVVNDFSVYLLAFPKAKR